MQIVSFGDNLHEMWKLYFLGKIRKTKCQFVICWISSESGKVDKEIESANIS